MLSCLFPNPPFVGYETNLDHFLDSVKDEARQLSPLGEPLKQFVQAGHQMELFKVGLCQRLKAQRFITIIHRELSQHP